MVQAGHYESRGFSPTGLGVVVAMHVAALGALALVKGPEFFQPAGPLETYTVVEPPVPEPNPEPPQAREEPRPQRQPTVIERTQVALPPIRDNYAATNDDVGPSLATGDGAGTATIGDRVELPPPVRVDARWDPRFAADQQPPYPPSEQRAQRDGSVRVELTIGADGRVKAIRRLSATSDAFWRATERHALARWRFRPATLDGRPVESSKAMTVYFRIEA